MTAEDAASDYPAKLGAARERLERIPTVASSGGLTSHSVPLTFGIRRNRPNSPITSAKLKRYFAGLRLHRTLEVDAC